MAKGLKSRYLATRQLGYSFTLLNIFLVKSLQVELLAQIPHYGPQSTRINLQSPQSFSLPE